MTANTRTVHDSMGELEIPENALYGAQTKRAVDNFPISGITMPSSFIKALAHVKRAAAIANTDLNLLDARISDAIVASAEKVATGEFMEHFPIDVFQTGSGTSTNMNMNEVLATMASGKAQTDVHPNDHVNMSQSSNDVIPTALHVSATMLVHKALLPSLIYLEETIANRADELQHIVKTGRTHLMDAMPVSMGQELNAWGRQINQCIKRIKACLPELQTLAIGGTAVGTGINAHPDFGVGVAKALGDELAIMFQANDNPFENLSCQDAAVSLSGQLRTTAVAIMKIANDLRWMNSGPLAGLGEITLPALQPGSSIMPGKINPVIPEALCMVATQVIGNDAAITVAGQTGNFELNVCLPIIAHNLLQSIEILANGARVLADKAIAGFTVNEKNINSQLERNPILVTALNRVIGYEKGAAIAKKAYSEGKAVIDVAAEMTDLSKEQLQDLLNPKKLINGGIV